MTDPTFGEDVEGESLEDADKKPDLKMPKEMAEKEFESWAEQFRIDIDENEMDAEERQEFRQIKRRFVYCLTNGITSIAENGDLSLKLIDSVGGKSEMIFRKKFKGSAFVFMDRYKDSQSVHKTFAFLAAWVQWDPKELTKLDSKDAWFGMKMVALFLGG